jgi:2-C-methyl-D-erythritol 4-phosphate cytidylyltransferase
LADPRIVRVAVALPPAEASSPPQWLTSLDARVVVVAGGRTRTESVRAAISALPDDVDVIAVHDAARPLVTSQVVARCLDLALEGFGAVAGCPAIDTLKVVGPDGSVRETPDRSSLWHAQTPQAFPAAILRAAYARPGAEGTDDAALVERADSRTVIKMVDAGPTNLKVTRLMDVTVAEAILRGRDGRGGA